MALRDEIIEVIEELGKSIESKEEVREMTEEDSPDALTLPGVIIKEGVSEYVQAPMSVFLDKITDKVNELTTDVEDLEDRGETVIEDAGSATSLANSAAGRAETAAESANSAATSASNQGDYAKDQGDYAKDQGDYAKNMSEHPAYIGEDNYWYLWDYATQKYVKDSSAKGDDLHYEEMTEQEKEDLARRVLETLAFASDDTCEDIINELT